MRAPDTVRVAAVGLVTAVLAWPPTAEAGVAERARSGRQTTPVERALTGGLVTLRSPGSTMIRIVASTFVEGSTPEEILLAIASCSREALGYHCNEQDFGNELPRRTLRLGSYWLDRSEVTAGDYDRCSARGLCAPRPLEGGARRFAAKDLPATFVSARDAETYCQSRGARLPTEAEFERAARGTTARRYPWGEVYNGRLANHGRVGLDASDWTDGYAELAPVGSFPAGRTPDGFMDLAGNAAEWTSDTYTERYGLDPDPAWGGARVIRGGHYESGAAWLRGAARTRRSAPDGRLSLRPLVRRGRAVRRGSLDGPQGSAMTHARVHLKVHELTGFVLVRPHYPENVGASARAIKTMGFDKLVLVRAGRLAVPEHSMAFKMSVRAWDVLEATERHDDLESATTGALVLATSSRRGLSGAFTAREAAALVVAEAERGRPTRILFGNEKTGLTSEELERAEHRLRIPMAGDQPSINLAQAVQLVAYEIFVAGLAARESAAREQEGAP